MHQQRKIVILNQATNYLTIGFANAFKEKFDEVVLVTGSVHTQGEKLDEDIKIEWINRWHERPASKKMRSYLQAMFRMWWLLMSKYRNHEVIFISVPPMAYLLNLILPHRFSMIIWDVYPDVFKILGMKESHYFFKVWMLLNKKSFKKSYKIFTISEIMADQLSKYIRKEKIIIRPIWSIFQHEKRIAKHINDWVIDKNLEDKFIVQYSGNIGLTHKVETLILLSERMRDNKNIIFQIIGRGPRKHVLEELVDEKNLPNCQFLSFQPDEVFHQSLSAADIGVVILDERASNGSVPSKCYNLMSLGIPSLYITADDSQLKLYADRYQHAGCFPEENLGKAEKFILQLAEDKELYSKYSNNSKNAAKLFRRENADMLIKEYLSDNNQLSR